MMVKILEADETPLAWRTTDPSVFDALCKLGPSQAVTDGAAYDDRYEVYKVVEAYRVLLRRYRPDLRLRCRIAYHDDEKYRWFARVEPRADTTK
jgi:hypothetical protein